MRCEANLEIAANKTNFDRQKWFYIWISAETRARRHERAKRRGILNIQGQTAIVTGGGSGLGAATARALAEKGAKVALFDINLEAAEKVAQEIGGLALACNVSSADDAQTAVARVAGELGTPRILVNCAGIANAGRIVGRDGPHDLELYRRVIEVNLIGSFNMLRLVSDLASKLEPLETGERGVIISTASVAAFDGQIGQAAYASSKAGIAGLTLPAARELARFGIRVMAIAPGIFGTPMLLAMPQEVQDSLAASIPFPSRLGKPEEYAALALHIIENPMLNGETIRLDGAIRMAPK
jgi:NAD(P)-dependent dehydrogenase (short-subunit alcohol dehydrogenase family)